MPRTAYAAHMARLRALEARHTASIRVALLRQAEAVAVLLESLPGPLTMPAVQLLAARVTSQGLLAPLEALYVAAGVPEARITYDELTGGPAKRLAPVGVVSTWTQRLRTFITGEGAIAVRGITEATRGIVRRVLGRAVEQGSSIPEAAAALRAEVASLASARARRISRTELLSASNAGSIYGAEATGLKLKKTWLATPSSRTRASHSAASGQTVGLADFFGVGGARARYPGDPLLPASERVNCRCSLAYIPI